MPSKKTAGFYIAVTIFALSFLALPHGAKAIGISPARIIMDFKPNMEGDIDFCIINNEQKNLPVQLYAKGDLQQYITLIETKAQISFSESRKCFRAHYKFPSDISGGHHDTRIGAVENIATPVAGTGVSALLGVELQFWIEAPVPGKLITAKIDIPETNLVGQPVEVKVLLKNEGKEATPVKVVFEVISPAGETLSRIDVPEIFLNSQETKEQSFSWNDAKIAGEY